MNGSCDTETVRGGADRALRENESRDRLRSRKGTENMKKVLLIATGGTIASKVTENGLSPAVTSAELLTFVPELHSLCQVDTVQLFNLDSTNICQTHWLRIAGTIREEYEKYDGFVITHGTDTMAYTAAALSYLIQNSRKPVVLTGSQKSIYSRDTDACRNLLCAFLYAVSGAAWGVHIVFDGKVILGTRARKVRTKSFDAFASIDYPEAAVFSDMRLISFLPVPQLPPVRFYGGMENSVFVLHLIPGMDVGIFRYLRERYRALMIEGFGVGGIPYYDGGAFLEAVRDWTACGKLLVFTTQVPHEGSDLGIYAVGSEAKKTEGVIETGNMTPEAAVTKLMWVLAQTHDRQEAEKLFLAPVCGDIF